jgi:hypothetical protein
MPELIDKNQSAFTRGRCIQDNFVLVQQAAVSLHRRKVPALLLKLDTRGHSSSRCFASEVLSRGGYGGSLCCWRPPRCWSTACSWSPACSPLLFVLVMDTLARMFNEAERRGVLEDLTAVGIKHRVSLYVDDVVVFAKPAEAEGT